MLKIDRGVFKELIGIQRAVMRDDWIDATHRLNLLLQRIENVYEMN